jgi:hypothetical protein
MLALLHIVLCVFMYIYVCVCVCVCFVGQLTN